MKQYFIIILILRLIILKIYIIYTYKDSLIENNYNIRIRYNFSYSKSK